MRTNRLLAALSAVVLSLWIGSNPVAAQWAPTVLPGGCGTGATVNSLAYLTVDSTLKLCVNATVSASVSGYHPSSSLTPITATTGGVTSSAFTAGQAILAQNVGATNAAYCSPGGSATTSGQYIAPGSSALIQTTTETTITCATSTSTTTVNFQVGMGLWTGAGGGGGGSGSSGAVFGPTAVGSAAANPPVLMGGTANGTATGNVAVAEIKAGNAFAASDLAVGVADPNVLSALNMASLCQGLSSEQAAVTTANPQKIMCDLIGKLITSPYANRENMVRGANSTTGTGATAFTGISAPGASLKVYLTSVNCGRTDTATGAIVVTLNDTASTPIIIPDVGGGGGNNKPFPVPLVLAANTAPTFTSGTGVSTLYCDAQGFTGY